MSIVSALSNWYHQHVNGDMNEKTHELGERFPSGVIFCCAGPSPNTVGVVPEPVLGVAEAVVRSTWAGV